MSTVGKNPEEQINRYIYEVTKRLPEKQRADIDKELHTLIEDMVQDQFPEKEATVGDINAVLKQLGDPRKFADRYWGEKQYLIGPEFYDIYFFVLKIVLAAVLLGMTVALVVESIVNVPESILQDAARIVSSIIAGAFQAFAWVTILFALIDHYGDSISGLKSLKAEMTRAKEWDPSELPEIPSQKALIKKSEPIVGIVFGMIFLILINYAYQFFGIISITPDGKTIIPIFDLVVIRGFLPLINIMILIGLAKEVVRLVAGRYTLRVSALLLLLSTASTILALVIFTDKTIWSPDFVAQVNALFSLDGNAAFDIAYYWKLNVRIFIGIVLFGYGIENLSNFIKSIRYGK